jgi:MFS family permease
MADGANETADLYGRPYIKRKGSGVTRLTLDTRADVSGPGTERPRRRALAALCVTEIVSYGSLYYAFPVLAGDITAGTGWSRTAITAAFSAGNVVGALAGVVAGRLIDNRGPRLVMTAGSVIGAAALAGIAAAPTLGWFIVAWLMAGVAMAGVFYPPAFAALTGWYGPDRVRALTTLTLAAGFASTIFAPLTAALDGLLTWRGVYLVLAAILAMVTIPAHALFLRLPWTSQSRPRHQPAAAGRQMRHILASRTFLLLVASMTLSAFALYAVAVNLVPLLTGRGLSPTLAAWALGLGGVGQVAGRLCYRPLLARVSVRSRAALITGGGGVCIFILAVLPGQPALLTGAAVLCGSARGLFTLLQATVVSDHWGPEGYASLNGVFSAPLTAATAIAPTIGAVLATLAGGYPALFLILAATGAASAVLALASGPAPRPAGDIPPAPAVPAD